AQCRWLGWSEALEPRLLAWMKDHHKATRAGNKEVLAQVAQEFDDIILSELRPRQNSNARYDDVTAHLCRTTFEGRLLTDQEVISILRNWTGGDLGSIALCVGVILHYIANHPELALKLQLAGDEEVEAFIDEVLRMDDPFISNRRVTTCPVHIGGQDIPSGSKIKLHWTSANRDELVFGDNDFNPVKNRPNNLVYGVGKHVCPGRLLATWQLRIMVQALLSTGQKILPASNEQSVREVAPLGGFNRVPIMIA
ncbi:cytochrome P450, partial [Alteromonas sp. 14N.309.X.WAT.G.H12]|uniref:cytochrome P450 n=1 Tax=Alteromonas sp. 14N.309.X.WAT.G.H12 TaxID=3120824 RepID=UPI002FD0A839